jgi:hypothetical protein
MSTYTFDGLAIRREPDGKVAGPGALDFERG